MYIYTYMHILIKTQGGDEKIDQPNKIKNVLTESGFGKKKKTS